MHLLQATLLFAATALAATPTDLPSAFASIEADTNALNTATLSFSGDICPIISLNNNLLADIQSGLSLAQSSSELTTDQIIAIVGPTQSLATAVQTAINSTISQYDAFVSAGYARVVLQGLKQQQKLSVQFSDAVVGDLPEVFRDVGKMNSAPIVDALARGVAVFENAPGSEEVPGCDGSSSATSSSEMATITSAEMGSSSTEPAAPPSTYETMTAAPYPDESSTPSQSEKPQPPVYESAAPVYDESATTSAPSQTAIPNASSYAGESMSMGSYAPAQASGSYAAPPGYAPQEPSATYSAPTQYYTGGVNGRGVVGGGALAMAVVAAICRERKGV